MRSFATKLRKKSYRSSRPLGFKVALPEMYLNLSGSVLVILKHLCVWRILGQVLSKRLPRLRLVGKSQLDKRSSYLKVFRYSSNNGLVGSSTFKGLLWRCLCLGGILVQITKEDFASIRFAHIGST